MHRLPRGCLLLALLAAMAAAAVAGGQPEPPRLQASSAGLVSRPGRALLANATSPSPVSTAAAAVALDRLLVLALEVRGEMIVPWTKIKSYIVSKALRDGYFPTSNLSDYSVRINSSFAYVESDDSQWGVRRRRLSGLRALLQSGTEKSGVHLVVQVAVSSQSVYKQLRLLTAAVANGTLAANITKAGVPTENVTLLAEPQVLPLADPVTSAGPLLQGWAVGLIVAVAVVAASVPMFFLVRLCCRRRRAAAARQHAAVAAAQAAARPRVFKHRSFSLGKQSAASSFAFTARSGGSYVAAGSQPSRAYSIAVRAGPTQQAQRGGVGEVVKGALEIHKPRSLPAGLTYKVKPAPATVPEITPAVAEAAAEGLPVSQPPPRGA